MIFDIFLFWTDFRRPTLVKASLIRPVMRPPTPQEQDLISISKRIVTRKCGQDENHFLGDDFLVIFGKFWLKFVIFCRGRGGVGREARRPTGVPAGKQACGPSPRLREAVV